MKCPFCDASNARVIDTREVSDGIRRRRECQECHQRFTTYERIARVKLLVVKQLNIENEETGGYVIAADAVQAGMGDTVLYATGSSARQTVLTDKKPCDAVLMAVVDTWDVNNEVKYKKGNE